MWYSKSKPRLIRFFCNTRSKLVIKKWMWWKGLCCTSPPSCLTLHTPPRYEKFYLLIYLSIDPSDCPSVYPRVRPILHPFLHPPTHSPTHPTNYPSIHPSVRSRFPLPPIKPFIHQSIVVCLSVRLSICLSCYVFNYLVVFGLLSFTAMHTITENKADILFEWSALKW